nr:MAG TPA_asm: hypothetical protein [Bacteriophage sp.]
MLKRILVNSFPATIIGRKRKVCNRRLVPESMQFEL